MASNPNWISSPDELASAPRNTVHAMIDGLIQWLDGQDGDTDLEEVDAEDSFVLSWYAQDARPGCPVSDPGEYAYPEWQSRGRHKNPNYAGTLPHEDAEDDDPGGGTGLEDEFDTRALGYSGAGCPIADPGGCEHDGREEEVGT